MSDPRASFRNSFRKAALKFVRTCKRAVGSLIELTLLPCAAQNWWKVKNVFWQRFREEAHFTHVSTFHPQNHQLIPKGFQNLRWFNDIWDGILIANTGAQISHRKFVFSEQISKTPTVPALQFASRCLEPLGSMLSSIVSPAEKNTISPQTTQLNIQSTRQVVYDNIKIPVWNLSSPHLHRKQWHSCRLIFPGWEPQSAGVSSHFWPVGNHSKFCRQSSSTRTFFAVYVSSFCCITLDNHPRLSSLGSQILHTHCHNGRVPVMLRVQGGTSCLWFQRWEWSISVQLNLQTKKRRPRPRGLRFLHEVERRGPVASPSPEEQNILWLSGKDIKHPIYCEFNEF